jgi:hypothetical protein
MIAGGCHKYNEGYCSFGFCNYRGECRCELGYRGTQCRECDAGYKGSVVERYLFCQPCLANGPTAIVLIIIGFIILSMISAWLSNLRVVRDMSTSLRIGRYNLLAAASFYSFCGFTGRYR